MAAEKADLLVTDTDGEEHVDEAVGSARSNAPSKDNNVAKPGSPFPRETSFTEMDAPSQKETILTVSTQRSCDSDRRYEKSGGSKIYKKMKTV